MPQSAASMAVLLRARLKPSVSFVLCTHDPTTSDATKAYAEVCCDAPSREFRDVKGSGGRSPHAAVSRRPPNSLDTVVARTQAYTRRRESLGFVHRSRTIFCRPVPNLRGGT